MNEITAPAARPTVIRWDRRRDKYGRSQHVAITAEGGEYGFQSLAGAVISMPKAYREMNPGQNVLVNLFGKGEEPHLGEVTYHKTVQAAKRYFEANALTREEFIEVKRLSQ